MIAGSALADECPAVPPPVVDLTIERYYEDGAGSVVEPTRMEAHKAQVAPLVEFVGFITKQADRAWQQRSSSEHTIACALSWLRGWAQGGAYLGQMNSKQAEAQRKWDLAGTSLAYVKLHKWASPEDRAIIEPWLAKWADAARTAFDDQGVKRNNHWYWLGLAQMGVAIATDDAKRWQTAKGIFEDALAEITPEGTLPMEMARQGRALHYHVFAAEPLVIMAEIAATRGEDWYALKDGALHRLVKKTAEGIADPTIFDKLAGVAQQRPIKPGYGWALLYRSRFFDRTPNAIEQASGHRYLGGQTDVLMRALIAKQ
jgi:poly(beta-D-mannuronate) lyase